MQIKEELIQVIVTLIEDILDHRVNMILQEFNERLQRMHTDIETMQEMFVKHFTQQIAHSRQESLGETIDTSEQDKFQMTINAELDNLTVKVQQIEYMNHLILDTQNNHKHQIQQLDRKLQPLQEQITKSLDEMRKDLKGKKSKQLEKQTFQWTVLNDQIERVEKYVQKLKQAELLQKKSK